MPNENRIILLEQTLLQKIISNSDLLYKVDEDILISTTAVHLLRSLKNLHSNDTSITPRNLVLDVNRFDNIDESSIKVLFESTDIDDVSFDHLYEQLQREKIKYEISNEITPQLLKEASKKGEFDTDKIQDLIRQTNLKILSLNTRSRNLIMQFDDMFDAYEQELQNRNTGKSFYDTGCSHLNDQLTEGFAPQKITTLFGASGVGKSTYALYLVNKQINKKIPSVYISLEMDLISTMDRLIAQRNKINISDLIPGEQEIIDDGVWDIIRKEREKLSRQKYFRFVEQSGLSLTDVDYIIKESMSQMGVEYLICTIDLLTMIKDFNHNQVSKANEYEHAMNGLHEIARNNNCNIVGVVQGKRPSTRITVEDFEDLEKFRPHIEEIKNSGAIEERSRTILSTFRQRHYAQRLLPDHPALATLEDVMDVEIVKQNMGALTRIQYLFTPEQSRITPYLYTDPEDAHKSTEDDISF